MTMASCLFVFSAHAEPSRFRLGTSLRASRLVLTVILPLNLLAAPLAAGNILGASVGQQLGSTSAEFIRHGMTVAPTLEIRPGYPFNVMVTQDVDFPGPYKEARHE
jgi:hypothetical protein